MDALSDAAEALIQAGLEAAIVRRVLREVRVRWTGQVYIQAIDRTARDQAAAEVLRQGGKDHEAAQVAGCSVSTIRRRRSEWLR